VRRALDILAVELTVAQLDLLVAARVADREYLAVGQSGQADRDALGIDPLQRVLLEIGQPGDRAPCHHNLVLRYRRLGGQRAGAAAGS
jgi:hypothetical protein